MADDANPRVFIDELFIEGKLDNNNGIVAEGYEFSTSGNLTASATPGTAYSRGFRVEATSSTPHTFTADKWTYTFICQDGSLDFVERNITVDLSTDEYPANCQPLSRVSTDSSAVIHVRDLRKLKFTLESYDSVFDESTESSLKNILVGNGNSYITGMVLEYLDASSFTVTAGGAMIDGEARDRGEFTSDSAWSLASTSEDDGLDVGSRGTGTYIVYACSDADDQRPYTIVWSLNTSLPSGKSKCMALGQFRNEGGTISKDSVIPYIRGSNILPEPAATIDAWGIFDGDGTIKTYDSFNISSFSRDGTGRYTFTWDEDFSQEKYAVAGIMGDGNGGQVGEGNMGINDMEVGSMQILVLDNSNASRNYDDITIIAIGDN
jgi:hypothetical protein